jgi:hypothetical protein
VWESIYGENWELPTFHSFSVAFYGFGGPLVLATDGLSENRVPKIHQNPLVTSGYWLILALPNFTSYF